MRFKIDENLPVEAARMLQAAGHSADTVLDENLGGSSDFDLAEVIRVERRTLLTLDLDFADIRSYPPQEYSGLIVIRPRTQSKRHLLKLLERLIPLFVEQPVEGVLWIVDESSVRFRSGDRS